MSKQHGDPGIYMHLLSFYILNLKPLLLAPAWPFPRLEMSLNLLNSAPLLAGDSEPTPSHSLYPFYPHSGTSKSLQTATASTGVSSGTCVFLLVPTFLFSSSPDAPQQQ